MTDELRIEIAKLKYGRVEERYCQIDPECGGIDEIQSFREEEGGNCEGDNYFLWPCKVEKILEYDIYTPVPDWPHSIADAWELVEEMMKPTPDTGIFGVRVVCNHETGWACLYEESDGSITVRNADTAPLAICRAWVAWKKDGKD